MADQSPREISKRENNNDNSGGPLGLGSQVKLILRLLRDPRVNPLLKVLPVGTLVYFLFPDLIVGPLDDAAVIGIGMYTFVELCPNDVVEEHRSALRLEAGKGS
jgi:hypothetical protein